MDDYSTTVDEVRAVCLKIAEAREKLRILGYREGVNQEYTNAKAHELNVIQYELEDQIRRR